MEEWKADPHARGDESRKLIRSTVGALYCTDSTGLGLREYDPRSGGAVVPTLRAKERERFERNESAQRSSDELPQSRLAAGLGDNDGTEDQLPRRSRPQTLKEKVVRDQHDAPDEEIRYGLDELYAPFTKEGPDCEADQ